MGITLVKNRQLNYLVTFFLVLIVSLSLAACGSTSGDGSADTTENLKDTDKISTIHNYAISGFGQIAEGDYFGTFLQIDNVTLSGGEFSFSDWIKNRVDFTSTSIKSISVIGDTYTIIADGTVRDEYGATFPGSFELIITDGNPDMFSIKINDTSGNELYNMPAQSIDMVNGDFTISIT